MMDAQKATAGAVQSVERAFDILEIMASAGGPPESANSPT